MKEAIVRVQSIELINFKNIQNGIIELPSYKNNTYFNGKGDVLGIYGQNGSGKTAVIEAFKLFKSLASGEELPEDIKYFIYEFERESTIKFTFYIERKETRFVVYYEFSIRKDDERVKIYNEKISYSKIINNKRTRKASIVELDVDNKNTPILPQSRYKELIKNKENEFELEVLRRESIKDNTSLIFNDGLIEIFKTDSENPDYYNIINTIKFFAELNLFVITNMHSAPISLNFIPFTFRMETESTVKSGDILVELLGTSDIQKDAYKMVIEIIDQLNIVLGRIIPNLRLEVINLGNELSRSEGEVIRIELMSIKNNFRIPLKYESEGIKRIISILSAMISVFNNPTICLVVDELDSGIFEYLLGELLNVFEERGKGQFIFTSHNLRALEMLDKESLIFSTANPKNRFTRISNIKSSNNLRNVYLRGIDLGGLNECIYEETNSFEIAHAFRKAGEFHGQK